MRKITAFKAKGLRGAKELVLGAIAQSQLSAEQGSGFIIEEDSPLLCGKFVETVTVREETFNLEKLEFYPSHREQVLVCQFMLDFNNNWVFIEGPMANSKALFVFLIEAGQGGVSIEARTVSLGASLEALAGRFGEYEVLKIRVSKIRIDDTTAFTGDMMPRGWSESAVLRMAQHWRSLTVRVAEEEAEGKVSIGRKAVLQLPDDLWLDGVTWTRFLAELVKASDRARDPEAEQEA